MLSMDNYVMLVLESNQESMALKLRTTAERSIRFCLNDLLFSLSSNRKSKTVFIVQYLQKLKLMF